ncbi:hypothetical protein [Myxosarcina sp. GI1]|uniref:hypothetical protein n=1 Tax=Myxosarcina sp. GI1 TaxID=1541065 RepID=UPI0006922436|nr:hypothetical protein [Myxosarcina sp. GI1]
MEELVQLRQMVLMCKTTEAIALIDELEEMSKRAIIRNIESYLVLLLSYLIKHQAEQRMTNVLATTTLALIAVEELIHRWHQLLMQ